MLTICSTLTNSRSKRCILTRSGWGLLAAVGVGLVAVSLTVARGLPYGHDSALHLYRQVERDHLLRRGLLFSRWSPFLSYGYGSPLFNYYPSLLHYLAEPFMLVGLGPVIALRVTLGLALVAGAVGVYLWVRDLFGSGPGVVAATAFIFSPYVMYTLLNRASFPEIVALAWMPWGLWTIQRYATGCGVAYGAVCAVTLAAILFSHLFSAYLYIAVLLLYGLVLGLTARAGSGGLTRVLRLIWPIGLGLGLAAFFWLPAMWEKRLVQVEQMLRIADPATGQGFVSPWMVFAGPVLPDLAIPVAAVPPRLSPLAAGVALLGVVSGGLALRSRLHRVHLLVAGIVVGMAVFMHTLASRWLWQAVPMLRLAQFPFRFLSAASLWLALLVGAGAGALLALLPSVESGPRKSGRSRMRGRTATRLWSQLAAVGLVAGLSLTLALYALGWPAIATHAPDLPTDLDAALQFERETETMGLQTGDEYRLQTVQERPSAESGPGPDGPRLDAGSLPSGAYLVDSQYDLLAYAVTVDSPQPFRAVFNTFYFPGWRAMVDGQRVSIVPTGLYGLISLDVPAGRRDIEVRFGSTPVRIVATGLSLASVAGLVGVLVWRVRRSIPSGRGKRK